MPRAPVALLALAAAACAAPAPSAPAPVVTLPGAPAVAAPAPARTFAPWDGVYVLTGVDAGEKAPVYVRTLSTGPSLALLGHVFPGTQVGGTWRFGVDLEGEKHDLRLVAPAAGSTPFRIAVEGMTAGYEQRVGPLEARLRDRLHAGQRFVRIDPHRAPPPDAGASMEASLTRDVITVLPRGLVRTELPDSPRSAACFIDALLPTADESGEPLASPLPAPGALGVVRYDLAQVSSDCDEVDLDAPTNGGDGGAFVFATADGRAAGVLMVAYMYAELFVAPGTTRVQVEAMRRVARQEMERQAE